MIRRYLQLSLLAITIMLMFGQSSAQAISSIGLKSILTSTPFYGADGGTDTCSSSSDLPVSTLPGGVPEPYNAIISAAAAKYGTDPSLVAAVFYWENRGFPSPDKTDWATSGAGAQGPMQFLPSTFAAHAQDGNGDGKKEITNIYDALYSGAELLNANGGKSGATLGTLDEPLAEGTLLRAAASYNWGGGNVNNAGANATLDDLPNETSDYMKAVYVLINSDFSEKPASGGEIETDTGDEGDATAITSTDGVACDTGSADIGEGTGQFIDNTATTIPGADQAIAKAQEIASYSPSQLQGICDGSPNCYRRCERLAGVIWGRESSGYTTANAHWSTAKASGKAHPGDRNVPPGAVLFYDTGSSAGHVATYLGGNKLMSNDVGDKASGITGGAYIVDAKDLEGGAWNLKYLGWVEPVPWI